jgi:hypothetical protein
VSQQTATRNYLVAAAKRFETVRALFKKDGFDFYRVRQPGLPISRYFCTKNCFESDFDTLADALVWLDQYKVRKTTLEAGDAE